jgi:hypothetical protein
MTLKNRLRKLEKKKRGIIAEVDCICFPPHEPPFLESRAEAEAAKSVLCPLHGERFSSVAPYIYRVIDLPVHLDPSWRNRRSPQYIKAMDASFPSDRWPSTKIVEPDGAVRFVLKDGTEIHRSAPPPEILDYHAPTAVRTPHVLKGRDW